MIPISMTSFDLKGKTRALGLRPGTRHVKQRPGQANTPKEMLRDGIKA